jgi:endonuclease/exonuclease/phosphatase family metal-dependent hydrolase
MPRMRLRIATYNLESLGDETRDDPPLETRIRVLRPALVALAADVLLLQEVSARTKRKDGLRVLDALDRLLEGTPYARFERASSTQVSGGPAAKHNVVILSRLPILQTRQHWHDYVAPFAPPIARGAATAGAVDEVRWDRPVLEAELACPDGEPVTVLDAHLRAPIAAFIEGEKLSAGCWRTTEGWSSGYFLAAMKRLGQALEIRRRVDEILTARPKGRVLVGGDLNATESATALRILRAEVEDTGNDALASRVLVPLEAKIPEEQRYTVIHRGRRQLLDHLLASEALARIHVSSAIHADGLIDEYDVGLGRVQPLGSLDAPLVAEFALDASRAGEARPARGPT